MMPEITSKVNFFETSSGSLQEGEGQRSGYPVPLKKRPQVQSFKMENLIEQENTTSQLNSKGN